MRRDTPCSTLNGFAATGALESDFPALADPVTDPLPPFILGSSFSLAMTVWRSVGSSSKSGSLFTFSSGGPLDPIEAVRIDIPFSVEFSSVRDLLNDILRLKLPLPRFCSRTLINLRSNAFRLICTTTIDTRIAEPQIISRNSMNCWKVFIAERFMVLSPAKVMAETTRKRESVYEMLLAGVEEPQNITLLTRQTPMKYA